jgi:hypothetical protein
MLFIKGVTHNLINGAFSLRVTEAVLGSGI